MLLSPEQEKALNAYKSGKNVFVTGPGGTGKSELIRTIVNHAKQSGKAIQVCATTGCAADLLRCGARTIHSWAGIGLAGGTVDKEVEKIVSSKNKQKQSNWKKTSILVIDEVSMMSAKLLHILDEIASKIKKNSSRPFGGIQLLLFGDFYQLPPIGDKDDPESTQYAFEYENWNELIDETIILKTTFRQSDPLFIKTLHQIRVGKLSQSCYQKLLSRVNVEIPIPEGISPTRLLPLKKHVNAINKAHMKKLESEVKTYKLEQIVERSEQQKDTLFTGTIDYEHSYLTSNCLCDKELSLKIGAQVMCIANIDMDNERPICNGSQGIIEGFEAGNPRVRFVNGRVKVIGYHQWKSERFPTVGIKQIPLILAWAITIHKAQGATLDYAEIDAGSGVFECGQTYVALSRVKSFHGLRLTAFDHNKIKIDKRVVEFYKKCEGVQ